MEVRFHLVFDIVLSIQYLSKSGKLWQAKCGQKGLLICLLILKSKFFMNIYNLIISIDNSFILFLVEVTLINVNNKLLTFRFSSFAESEA